MANSNDPVEALRKSLNAYVVAQDAMTRAAAEVKPAEPQSPQPQTGASNQVN